MSLKITIELNVFERRFLKMLADRGRIVEMDDSLMGIETKKALEELEKKGPMVRILLVGNRTIYKLTDVGANLVGMFNSTSGDCL